MSKADKIAEAERILEACLAVGPHVIGSKEEEQALKLLRRLPAGLDTEKVKKALVKMGALNVFRYAASLSTGYLPVLKNVLGTFLDDTSQSRMMLHCLYNALEKDFTLPESCVKYGETAAFLQYVDKFLFPVVKPGQYAISDRYISAALVKDVEQTLTSVAFVMRDLRAFNSLVYVLAKSDSSACEAAVAFQDKDIVKIDRLYKLKAMLHALAAHKQLPNTARGYQRAYDTLRSIQLENSAYQIISRIGLDASVDLDWSIEILVGAKPGEPDRLHGHYISASISNAGKDSVVMEVSGPKGKEKGNQKSGIIEGKGLGFRKIDVFHLRPEMDEIAKLYGIEKLCWEDALIQQKGFAKGDMKKIKKLLS